jgi:hypothetical protein
MKASFRALVILGVSTLLLCTGMQITHAAPSSPSDSLVVAAKDLTPLADCHLSHGIKATHSSPVTWASQSPCPANTIMEISIIRRSQAVALHERYVVLPAHNAASAVQSATMELLRLIDTPQPSQHTASTPNAPLSCSYFENVVSASGTVGNDQVYSTLDYQKETNCTVYFYSTTAQVTSGNQTLALSYGTYETYRYPSSGYWCDHYYTSGVSQNLSVGTYDAGHYFDQYSQAEESSCGYPYTQYLIQLYVS